MPEEPFNIRVHLDTGDSRQVRQRNIVIRNEQIRAPHYDTLAMAPRTPLSDITNLSTNPITSAPTRRPISAMNSFPNIQNLMLNDKSYDFSNRREFAKDLERIESSEDAEKWTTAYFIQKWSRLAYFTKQQQSLLNTQPEDENK